MSDDAPCHTHLLSYRFKGDEYGIEIEAADVADAKARLRAIKSNATYDGVLVARVRMPRWWARLVRWWVRRGE